jgi:Concanavalin A-like lectin/glucanases superfamily
MKHRKLALATLVVALMVLLIASSPAWAVLLQAANWRMNETSGKMLDSSRHNNHGTPRHVARTGSTYVFNGTTSRVVVPDHASLDPAGEGITLRAQVRVPNHAMDDDSYDVVRKGYATTAGGDYKMEILRTRNRTVGKLHCLFKGSRGRVSKVARPDIVDGRWHTLSCTKTRTSVVARVDGRSYTIRDSAGSISNGKEVLVGAKTTRPLDDMFRGSMNFVRIYITR